MHKLNAHCQVTDGVTVNVYINRNAGDPSLPTEGRVQWTVGPVGRLKGMVPTNAALNSVHTQRSIDMALILTDEQKVTLSVAFVTAKGNPATVDGPPVWTVSNDTVLSVVPSADGLSADVVSVGPLGASQVSVTADADLGAGVTALIGTLDVTVVASEAASIVISAGTPVLQ